MSKKLFVIATFMAVVLVACGKTPEEEAAAAAAAEYAKQEQLAALYEAKQQAEQQALMDALPEVNADNCYNVEDVVPIDYNLRFKRACRKAGHTQFAPL